MRIDNTKKVLLVLTALLSGSVLGFVAFSVFSKDATFNFRKDATRSVIKETPKPKYISMNHFGDIMFDRLVKTDVKSGKNPFENLKGSDWDFLREADFNVANLEGPISTTTHCQKKEINFEFEPGVEVLIKDAGFNLLNLANNHAYDCYIEGATDTAKYLDEVGIGYFGGEYIDKPYIVKEIHGKKIAFIGFYSLLPSANISAMTKQITELKLANDFVVVHTHWGVEYQTTSSLRERNIAHQWIDAGADVIIGHHPHVIQEMEMYKNKPIFYSLGNFIFDQNFGQTMKGLGVELKLSLEPETKNTIKLHPYILISRQPRHYTTDEQKAFCDVYLKAFEQVNMCEISY